MSPDIRTWLSAIGEYRFWLEVGGAVVVVLIVSALVTNRAKGRAESLSDREETLVALAGAADDWQAGFVAPTPAESTAWRRSERRVEERGVGTTDRVALAQLVAQRAEELGIPDVAVGFVDTSELTPPPVRSVDAWSFDMAEYAVSVSFTADYPTAVSFVGSLPPQVEVRRLTLVGSAMGLDVSALLTVARVTGGGHGAP